VFYEPVRRFYDIEGLWIDAPRLPLPFEEEPYKEQPAELEEEYA